MLSSIYEDLSEDEITGHIAPVIKIKIWRICGLTWIHIHHLASERNIWFLLDQQGAKRRVRMSQRLDLMDIAADHIINI